MPALSAPSLSAPCDPSDVFVGGVAAFAPEALVAYFETARGVALPQPPDPLPAHLAAADAVLAGRFSAVGETHALGCAFSWAHNPSRDKEWLIAHHKFYFAVDLAHAYRASGRDAYLACWRALIEGWLDEMGSGFITASDAQVEAKRLEHWVGSFLLIQAAGGVARLPAGFLRRFLGRIASEAVYVANNLRPGRNHRTFQLYAIFLVGVVFPELRPSEALRAIGHEGLCANLAHDFADDGVHIELSSHYHQITLETALAFVELARLNAIALPRALLARLHRAARFSMWLTWPDGNLPLVGDADNGDHRPLLALAARLFDDPQLRWGASGGSEGAAPASLWQRFATSGYFVLGDGWGHDPDSYRQRQHVLYDCGPLGEGSHSQYDLFSFTYFAGGRPILVDPGRYTYCADPGPDGIDWRHVFKSTASHNTVTIDGRDQTRYLSKSKTPPPGIERHDRSRHSVKHGPDVVLHGAASFLGSDSAWILGTAHSHEYTPRHTRLFAFVRREYLVVLDRIECEDGQTHLADLRFHFAAAAQAQVTLASHDQHLRALGPGWQLDCIGGDELEAALEPGWVSTTYGIKDAAPVLSVRQRSDHAMAFATVITSDASPVRIERIDWSHVAYPDALAVDIRLLCADGVSRCDLLVLRAPGAVEFEARGLAYGGEVLLCRCDPSGAVEYLCASQPDALTLPRGPGVAACGWHGEPEWSATTTR